MLDIFPYAERLFSVTSRIRVRPLAILAASLLVACGLGDVSYGVGPDDAAPIVSFAVAPESVSLQPGGELAFTATATRADGASLVLDLDWSATGGTITPDGRYTADSTPGSFLVIATQRGGTLADTSAVRITLAPTGTTLVSEGFESPDLSGAWFDVTSVSLATDARPGSPGSRALEWHWTESLVVPQGASRVDFAPTNSVYLSYWVKVSANWVGSSRPYHPHMFQFITTADDHYIGPARTHLTLYDELLYDSSRGGLVPLLALQDALMIDADNLFVDLTNLTEQRAIGGYNGRPEPGLRWDAYESSPGTFTNYKIFEPDVSVMNDATKSSWHHVESYWQLNTVEGGRGQPNGVVQYWFDGELIIDRHDIYFRTAVNSSMQIRTFLMAPYIGDGSPRDQYMWIDDLEIRTARP